MEREYEQLKERIRRLEQQLAAVPITMAGGGGGNNSAKLIKLTENDGEPFYSWTIQKWDENNDEPEDGTKEGEYDEDNRAYDIYKNPDLPEDTLVFAWKNPGGGLWFFSDPIWEATVKTVASNASFTAYLRLDNTNTTKVVSVVNVATAIDIAVGKRCWLRWNGVVWNMIAYAC